MSASPPPAQTSVHVDEDEEDRLDEEALAEMEAQGSISWSAVKRWMQSWGSPNPLAPPQAGD